MRKPVLICAAILMFLAGCRVAPETHVVKFVTNTEAVIEDVTVEEGKQVQAPTTPKNEGYMFDGWYVDAVFSGKYDFNSEVMSDLTLYAKWILIETPTVRWAGIRVSSYGMKEAFGKMPDVETMSGFAGKMEGCYEGSEGTYLLIVGTISRNEDCDLNFPVSGDYDHINGSRNDRYEAYLDKFDEMGYSVWLQVEPGYADLVTLVDLVMKQYGHHSCVKGFGIDVEWHKPVEGVEEGTKLTDADASKVLAKLRTFDPDYTLFVKHWDCNWLPSGMDGLIYVDDWQYFKSKKDAVNVFSGWAKKFAPYPVMFQIGYGADKWIWNTFTNPAQEFGQLIVDGCYTGNDVGVIWVDFTLDEVIGKIRDTGKTEE